MTTVLIISALTRCAPVRSKQGLRKGPTTLIIIGSAIRPRLAVSALLRKSHGPHCSLLQTNPPTSPGLRFRWMAAGPQARQESGLSRTASQAIREVRLVSGSLRLDGSFSFNGEGR